MLSQYCKAASSYSLWWVLLFVVLAWAVNIRRVGIKISEAPRTRCYHNSRQKRKYQSKRIKRYNMAMGIRKLNPEDWLRVDENFSLENNIRSELLTKKKDKVLQCLPGSEDACVETLEVVVKYLTENFPDTFKISCGCDRIRVVDTGETLGIKPPFNNLQPLEVAARLVMEDLTILSKDCHGGEHHVIASATLFPVGWSIRDRIGWSLSQLHRDVPAWQKMVGRMAERLFTNMSFEHPLERSTFFVQVVGQDESTSDILCQLEASHKAPDHIENIMIRRERQTFRRLPRSNAVLFTVKTDLQKLSKLSAEDLLEIATEIRSWPDEMATYKGKERWGKCVLDFCDAFA